MSYEIEKKALHESPLITAGRMYGLNSDEFTAVMRAFTPTEHVEAIHATVDNALFNPNDEELVIEAVTALTVWIRQQADDTEKLVTLVSVDPEVRVG